MRRVKGRKAGQEGLVGKPFAHDVSIGILRFSGAKGRLTVSSSLSSAPTSS